MGGLTRQEVSNDYHIDLFTFINLFIVDKSQESLFEYI